MEKQKSQSKSNLFIAVFVILAIHIVLFGGLLAQGCRREKPQAVVPPDTSMSSLPDTNLVTPPTLPVPSTNPTVAETPGNAPSILSSTPQASTPFVSPEPSEPVSSATQSYTVVKNDSFARIAKNHGITIASLSRANPNVDSRKLKVGQALQIPAKSAEPATPSSVKEPASSDSMTTYVVKPGDTLIRIAKTHATTVSAIRKANHFKTDRLSVGQKLKIPAPKSPTTAEPSATATAPSDQPAGGTSSRM